MDSNFENLDARQISMIGPYNAVALTGNLSDNLIYGGGGNDSLFGAEISSAFSNGDHDGADTLIGGVGDDFYRVFDSDDVVIENQGEGHDIISVFGDVGGTYTLAENVEELIYSPGGAIHNNIDVLIGNKLDNYIQTTYNDIVYGGLGNDTVLGGSGNKLFGGMGDDLYRLLQDNNQIVEYSNEGVDTVSTKSTL